MCNEMQVVLIQKKKCKSHDICTPQIGGVLKIYNIVQVRENVSLYEYRRSILFYQMQFINQICIKSLILTYLLTWVLDF